LIEVLIMYVVVGYLLNFVYVVWDKSRHPEQRPQTMLELLIMVLLFLVGVLIWPLAWCVRIVGWVRAKS